MPRATAEWIGKSPDAKVPARVRLRILLRYDRKCYLSGAPIPPGAKWELEHIKSLILGGEHRESNLAPALADPHKRKTAVEAKVKAKADAIAKRQYGITQPAGKLQGRGFSKPDKPQRTGKPVQPPRALYRIVKRGELMPASHREDGE